jgi:thiamine phosphate synthase YjbQ (UPF0047 family)
MRVVYDKEGTDPCSGYAHYCECVPVTSFRTGINDDESGLHHDYEVWLEGLAPHAPIDQAGPEAGCTIAQERTPVQDGQERRRAPEAADHGPDYAGREVVVAVTNGRLDFGTWERIFYGEFDGRRRKRVLVKIIGE